MSHTLFTTDKNYMKRAPSSGQYSMTGPDTLTTFAYYVKSLVIPHGVTGANGAAVVPMFRMFYEPFGDGKIIEAFQDDQNYFSNPINTYGGITDGPPALVGADDTNITIKLYSTDNTLAGTTFPLYLIVYEDYGVA